MTRNPQNILLAAAVTTVVGIHDFSKYSGYFSVETWALVRTASHGAVICCVPHCHDCLTCLVLSAVNKVITKNLQGCQCNKWVPCCPRPVGHLTGIWGLWGHGPGKSHTVLESLTLCIKFITEKWVKIPQQTPAITHIAKTVDFTKCNILPVCGI